MNDVQDTDDPIAPPLSRVELIRELKAASKVVVDYALALTAVPSCYPPGDTRSLAALIADIVKDTPGLEIEHYQPLPHVMNVVLRVRGRNKGKRLVFNGHMDTFPLVDGDAWTAMPTGELRADRLYGLGISDMKGGLAGILFALRQLAARRDAWNGEVVATLVGDEESMGVGGTQWLLDNVPHASGDAMISADTGSMRVLRFGEKGLVWLTLEAKGRSAHAAHVHRGDSAIEKLVAAITAITSLRSSSVDVPDAILQEIDRASKVSEELSGVGESEVLRKVTMTVGTIQGGRLPNLVADTASATVDMRLPVGTTVAEIEQRLREILAAHPDVTLAINRRGEPSWTEPCDPVIITLQRCCEEVSGEKTVVNMRVGASDSRLYRRAGVPTVVCGLTPHNMGAPDEYILLDELRSLAVSFSLTGLDYLSA